MAAAPEPHETEKKVMFAVGHWGKEWGCGGAQAATRFPRPIPMAARYISHLSSPHIPDMSKLSVKLVKSRPAGSENGD